MSPPTSVAEAIQSPELAGLVELFDLDLSTLAGGAPVLGFVSDHAERTVLTRDGDRYYPVPLEVEGFDRGGGGPAPQPVLRVGDVLGQLGPWVWAGQDLVGAEVTRTVVLRQHLDDGDDPDPTAYLLLDVYRIDEFGATTAATQAIIEAETPMGPLN